MSEPFISVVMPAFNAAGTIRRAIESILDGTWKKLEMIVVDDGSTDQTVEVVRSIKNVRLLEEPHRGVASAMNTAVAESSAGLIARMDADDISHPRRLEQQVELLETQQLDIVGGKVSIIDRDGNPVPSMERYERWVNSCLTHEQIIAQRFIESPLVHPSTLARRHVFELGFRDGPFPEDYDFWLRSLQKGYRAAKVPSVVLEWTDGPDRLTRTDDRYSMEAFDRCRRQHLLLGPLHKRRNCNLWGAGMTGKGWLRWLKAAGFEIGFVVEVSPGKIGKRIHDVPVISPAELPTSNGVPILIAVGAEGAREQIEPVLTERGYSVGLDAWFVA